MELPAQAIPARLTNMCATGDTWPVQATRRFTQLVAHHVVMARVTSVSNVVSVCLCDTSGDDDVHINDVLIRNGLAKKCRDHSVSRTASTYVRTVCGTLLRMVFDVLMVFV